MFEDEDLRQTTNISDDDWSIGAVDAPITILEYGDFECPYCAMARTELEQLLVDDRDAFRLVFRHFPLKTIHPHAVVAAEAAEASGAQGRFWEMYDLLFAHQHQLGSEHIHRYARALQLDIHRFEQDLSAHAYLDEVQRDFRRGIQDGVNGTPSILINGWRYDGPRERMAILSVIAGQIPSATSEHEIRLLDRERRVRG